MNSTDGDTISAALRAAGYNHNRACEDDDTIKLPMRVYTGQELLTLLGILQKTPTVSVTLDPTGITIN